MSDLNCGIQAWFIKPSFILKIFLGLFAFVSFIRLIIIDVRLYKHVWRAPVKNGNIAGVLTFFFILAIIVTILIHFSSIIEKIPIIGSNTLYQVIIAGSIGGFTLLFALIFGCKNVRTQYYNEITDQKTGIFWVYWKEHSTDIEYIKWSQKYQTRSEKIKYFKDHSFIPGLDVLGLFITMAILDAIILLYFYLERKAEGFKSVNDQTEFLNSSLYENNSVQ